MPEQKLPWSGESRSGSASRSRTDDGFVPVTLDVYHSGSAPPPASPDVQTTGRIREIYTSGTELDGTGSGNVPSHVIVVGLGVDVRDGASEIGTAGDSAYVPDMDGTRFDVYAVVRRGGERWCYCRRVQRPSGAFTPY